MHRPSHLLRLAAAVATLAAAAPAARADTFVLIVANNRSLRPHLPDLQYADDDAIRYYQLWESLDPEARLALLAEPDVSTARANPGFARLHRAPTRANLLVEAAALAEAVRQARQAGRNTTLYFVFAGHGDVEQGRGFLELADGRLGADDLEAVVAQVNAAQTHLILDSCNSYFMYRPRKPGGRPLAGGLARAGALVPGKPDVGAFLSTSSEQTVYEWSETQSGIFSFLVRSGLMGGADADGDGRITYDELRGFVAVASRSVPNPAVRPQVFAQAPRGDGGQVLLDLRASGARALELPPGERFILRNADGFRLAELHTEGGFAPRVRLWGGPDLNLERLVPSGEAGGRPVRSTYDLPDSGSVRLADLAGRPPGSQVRGADRMFQALFERPFGPQALARELAEERAAPTPVFGLSRADTDRLRLNLDLLAKTKRDDRLSSALWQGLVATVFTGLAFNAHRGDTSVCGQDCNAAAVVFGSVGAVFGGLTIWNLIPGPMERLADRGRRAIDSGADPGVWLPQLGQDLDRLAAGSRLYRRVSAGVVGGVLGLVALGTLGDAARAGRITGENVWDFGFWTALAGTSTWLLLQESPAERQIRALKADPLWQGIAVGVTPAPGGLSLALTGRF